MLESVLLSDILISLCTQAIQNIKSPLHIPLIWMNHMITIRLFWMLFSWLYWLPVEPAWTLKGHKHKHINGNAHRSYQVLLFFMSMGQPL